MATRAATRSEPSGGGLSVATLPDNAALRAAWTTLDPLTRAALGMAAARAIVFALETMAAEAAAEEMAGMADEGRAA